MKIQGFREHIFCFRFSDLTCPQFPFTFRMAEGWLISLMDVYMDRNLYLPSTKN